MKYFIFTLFFALQVLGQNTRVLPRGISIPAGSVLVGNSTGVGTTTPVGISGQFLQSAGTSTPVWKNIQGGGEVNFITNGDGQDGTTGFVTGSYSAADKPAGTFTASSGSSAFEVANTFAPLGTGTTSLTFTKYAGASRQGRAVEYEFNLPVAYRAKVLTIKNQYIINSGTFVAGTNSTNSSMIFYTAFYNGSSWSVAEPSSFKLLSNSSTVSDVFSATVQSPSNATKMKLIAYVSETATTAWEVKANLSVSPSTYVFGTPITDWQSYTPTGSWVSNTTYSGRWMRSGDSLLYYFRLALSGAPTATGLTVNFLPPNVGQIDTAKMLGTATNGSVKVGDCHIYAATGVYYGSLYYNGTSSVGPVVINAASTYATIANLNTTVPATFTSGDSVECYNSKPIPIVGWSSSVQMSDQADTRVVAAYKGYNTPTGTLSNSYNVVKFSGMDKDTHSGYNASTGLYTVPVSGYYRVSSTLEISKTSYSAGNFNLAAIYVNGSPVTYGTSVVSGTTTINATMVSGTVFANAGDTIGIYSYCSAATGLTFTNTAGGSNFSLERISGPSAIAATESISASYTRSTSHSVTSGSDNDFIPQTKLWDTHSAFNTSNGEFTCPISGEYELNALTTFTAYSGGGTNTMKLYLNGSSYKVGPSMFPNASVGSAPWTQAITAKVRCVAGDKIKAVVSQGSGSTQNLNGNASQNYIEIRRVGN